MAQIAPHLAEVTPHFIRLRRFWFRLRRIRLKLHRIWLGLHRLRGQVTPLLCCVTCLSDIYVTTYREALCMHERQRIEHTERARNPSLYTGTVLVVCGVADAPPCISYYYIIARSMSTDSLKGFYLGYGVGDGL